MSRGRASRSNPIVRVRCGNVRPGRNPSQGPPKANVALTPRAAEPHHTRVQETLRVGLIGSGGMGLTWAEVVDRYTPGASLVALWGGSRAEGLAAQYGCDVESSLGALLARQDIDAVVIASPLATHRDYVVAAAAARKHIFLEKPMCVTLAQADEMITAADAADVRLAVVTQHRFRRTPVAARRLITEGAIGEVRMVEARGLLHWPEPAPGHVPWAELGYHVCDVLGWLIGSEATQVSAFFTSFGPAALPAKSVMAIFQFASGALAHVWLTYELPPPGYGSQMQYLVTGSEGIIDLDSYAAVRLGTAAGWQTIDEQPPSDPADPLDRVRIETYVPQFHDFVVAVAEHRDPAVSGRDARRTMAMLLAAVEANATGEVVSLAGRTFSAVLR